MPLGPVSECYFNDIFEETDAGWWAALAVFLLSRLANAARKRQNKSTAFHCPFQ